jgi:O-antigen/teichoic acid export membrane protein
VTPTEEEVRAAAAVRRVGLNAASLLAAYVLPRVFTIGAIVLAARILGTQRFGEYGAAAAFAVILSLLATLGMHPLLVRDLARDPALAPRLLRAAHLVKSTSVAVMLVLVFALSRWGVGFEGDALTAALLLGVAYALGAYTENLSAYFHATERMHVWAEASALNGLVTGSLGALLASPGSAPVRSRGRRLRSRGCCCARRPTCGAARPRDERTSSAWRARCFPSPPASSS